MATCPSHTAQVEEATMRRMDATIDRTGVVFERLLGGSDIDCPTEREGLLQVWMALEGRLRDLLKTRYKGPVPLSRPTLPEPELVHNAGSFNQHLLHTQRAEELGTAVPPHCLTRTPSQENMPAALLAVGNQQTAWGQYYSCGTHTPMQASTTTTTTTTTTQKPPRKRRRTASPEHVHSACGKIEYTYPERLPHHVVYIPPADASVEEERVSLHTSLWDDHDNALKVFGVGPGMTVVQRWSAARYQPFVPVTLDSDSPLVAAQAIMFRKAEYQGARLVSMGGFIELGDYVSAVDVVKTELPGVWKNHSRVVSETANASSLLKKEVFPPHCDSFTTVPDRHTHVQGKNTASLAEKETIDLYMASTNHSGTPHTFTQVSLSKEVCTGCGQLPRCPRLLFRCTVQGCGIKRCRPCSREATRTELLIETRKQPNGEKTKRKRR